MARWRCQGEGAAACWPRHRGAAELWSRGAANHECCRCQSAVVLVWARRMTDTHRPITVNRAPVLTLWAAVVAERLGFDRDEALTLGRAVAGLNAYSKGVALGLFEPTPEMVKERRKKARPTGSFQVALLGRAVPAVHTPEGVRALAKNKPIAPASVERYLVSKFGDALDDTRKAMTILACSIPPAELAGSAFRLYEQLRPTVPAGAGGWGAKGKLDLEKIQALAQSA